MHLRRVEIQTYAGTSYILATGIVRHNDCFAFGDRRDAFRTLDDRCGLMERAIRNHVFRATTIRFLAAHRQEFVLDDGVVCPIAFGILNGFRFGHLPEQIMRILNHLSHVTTYMNGFEPLVCRQEHFQHPIRCKGMYNTS